MNQFFQLLVTFLSLLTNAPVTTPVHLPQAEAQVGPRTIGVVQSVPKKFSARAYLVLDRVSGEILSGQDYDRVFPIASLTKLATALTFLELNPNLTGELSLEASDIPADGKHVFEVGDSVAVRDLFAAMLVASANDAARALARSSKLDAREFASRMHLVSRRAGAAAVTFNEPTGLSSQNRATARAVARLFDTALRRPKIAQLLRTQKLEIKTRTGEIRELKNTNRLLLEPVLNSPYEIFGGKTGFIEESGYNLVTAIRGPQGQEVLVVVLGADDHLARFAETDALARWAFSHFSWKNIGG